MLKPLPKFLGLFAFAALQIGLFGTIFHTGAALAEDMEERFDACAGDLIDLDAQLPPENRLTPEKISAACADSLRPEDLSICVVSIVKNTDTRIIAEDALKSCLFVRRPIDLARCVVRINDRLVDIATKPEDIEPEEREEPEEVEEMEEKETEQTEMEVPPTDTPPQTPPENPENPTQVEPPTDTPPADNPPPTPPTDKEVGEKQNIKQTTPPPENPPQGQPPTPPPNNEEEMQPPAIDPNLVFLALDNCRSSLLPLRFSDCTLGLQQEIPDYRIEQAMTTCLSAEDRPSPLLPVNNESR